jgi:hypothetical protein
VIIILYAVMDIVFIIHDITCSNNCHSRKDISYLEHVSKDNFIFFCHRDLWLFSFLFLLLFHLCSNHYSLSSAILFSSHNVYFLISPAHVHSPLACTNHCNFQPATMLERHSSSLSYIIITAPSSQADL